LVSLIKPGRRSYDQGPTGRAWESLYAERDGVAHRHYHHIL